MLKQGITASPQGLDASLSPWYVGNHIGFNHPCYEFNHETMPDLLPPTTFGYYELSCGWGGIGAWVGEYLIAGSEIPTWNDCPMPVEAMTAHITLSPPLTDFKKKYNIAEMSWYFADDFPSITDYREQIKCHILNYGAIQSYVHLEAIDLPGMISQIVNGIEYTGYRFMDKENFDMYTYEMENFGTILFTHAVGIIGWDDNRRINVGGHTATGAWLIKDSNGETSWDGGYFWVAYDDPAINVIALGLVAGKKDKYAHQSTYQTHPGIMSKILPGIPCNDDNCLDLGLYGYLFNGNASGTSWAVAEFPIIKDETLVAIGIFSGNRNQKVHIEVHKNSLANNPLHTQTFTPNETGYHLLELGNDILFLAHETMVLAAGYETSPQQPRLPLCYVLNEDHNFAFNTYFGTKEGNVFQLTPYAEFDPRAAFYMQAVVRK